MENNAWIFALLTAIWFGLVAFRAGRNWWAWALAGAMFALPTATIILGLKEAAFSPVSQEAVSHHKTTSFILAAVVIGIIGWFATLPLQKWHLRYWREKPRTPQTPSAKEKGA